MNLQEGSQSTDYAQAVAELVAKLPLDRAVQVYDFARFLQAQSQDSVVVATSDDDWLHDSDEQMEAEDALWDAAFDQHRDHFTALADAARAEIKAGATQPLFDEHGDVMIDELPHHQ